MTNEIRFGCPECSMSFGMSSTVSKITEGYQCTANPAHRFKMCEDGFLRSL